MKRDPSEAAGRLYAVYLPVMIVATLTGLVVRLLAARGELWLDEVWSLKLAIEADRILDILTLVNVDNNHVLNTIWLYVLGESQHELLYRLPAIISGSAMAIVAALYARRWGMLSAVVVLIVMNFSHPLIHYTSEARGYAPALFCSFAALSVLDRFLVRYDFTSAALFAVICILGMVSHLLFLQVYAALLFWSLYRAAHTDRPWSSLFTVLCRAHLLPIIAIAYLYVFHLRHIWIAGGPSRDLVDVVLSAAALFCGLPPTGSIGVFALALLVGVLIAGLSMLRRRDPGLSLFFLNLIIVIPAIMLALARPAALFERYFLFNGAFLLFLGAIQIADLLQRRGVVRWIALTVLLGFLATNGIRTVALIRLERGHYRDLLRYLDTHSPAGVISVSGDQNFRHRMMFDHYARSPVTERAIEYVGFYTLPREGVRWFIQHSREPKAVADAQCRDRFGNRYDLVAEYRSDVLSGYHLFLYHARRPESGMMRSELLPVPIPIDEDRNQ